MSVFGVRVGTAVVVALAAALGVSVTVSGQNSASASKGETEWRFFGSDNGATRYSPANGDYSQDSVNSLTAQRDHFRFIRPTRRMPIHITPHARATPARPTPRPLRLE